MEEDQDLVGLDEIAVDQEDTGEDQNGDLLTTPGSSTTGKQQHLKFLFLFYLLSFYSFDAGREVIFVTRGRVAVHLL
jgi:hypothetical protein